MENKVSNPDEGIEQEVAPAKRKPKKEKKEKKPKPPKAPKAPKSHKDSKLKGQQVPDAPETPKEPEEPKPPKEPKPYGIVAGYRILAIATLVLTIGGLFLGAIETLSHTYYTIEENSTDWSSFQTVLSGSLLDYAIHAPFHYLYEIFHNLSDVSDFLQNALPLCMFLLLIVAVVAAPICTLITVFSRKHARSAAVLTALLSFLAYGLLCLWNVTNELVAKGWTSIDVDIPVAIVAGCLFAGVAATVILKNKVRGGMMVVSVCCTLAMVLGLVYPGSSTATNVAESFNKLSEATFLHLMAIFMYAWLGFHVVATLRRITSKRRYGYDIVRYGVLLVLILGYSVSASFEDGSFAIGNLFKGKELISTVLLLAGCVVGLILSIVGKLIDRNAPATEEAAGEHDAQQDDPQQQKQPQLQPNPYGYGYAPQVVPQYYNPYVPVTVPVSVAPVAPVVPGAMPMEEPKLSDFEREMLSLASSPDAVPEPTAVPTPVFVPRTQAAMAQPERSIYGDGAYTYDPFFTTLTNSEKDEFGDLFIAHKKGEYSDLPSYKVGGDNKEFFNKIWIHYSRYDMSLGLREKIFAFVRLHKK